MNQNSPTGANVLGFELRPTSGASSLAGLAPGKYPISLQGDDGTCGVALLRVSREHLALELELERPAVKLGPVLVGEAGAFDAGFLHVSARGSRELAVTGRVQLGADRLYLVARVEGHCTFDGEQRIASALRGSSPPLR